MRRLPAYARQTNTRIGLSRRFCQSGSLRTICQGWSKCGCLFGVPSVTVAESNRRTTSDTADIWYVTPACSPSKATRCRREMQCTRAAQ